MKSIIKCIQPEKQSETKLLNTTVVSVCEAIVDLGGFDEFLKLIDVEVLEEYDDCICSKLKKYMRELKHQTNLVHQS